MREIDNEQGVSNYTKQAVKTLQNLRWKGEGPAYVKLGGSVKYRKVDVDRWIEQNIVQPKNAGGNG